jgi:hypothetical protein
LQIEKPGGTAYEMVMGTRMAQNHFLGLIRIKDFSFQKKPKCP